MGHFLFVLFHINCINIFKYILNFVGPIIINSFSMISNVSFCLRIHCLLEKERHIEKEICCEKTVEFLVGKEHLFEIQKTQNVDQINFGIFIR